GGPAGGDYVYRMNLDLTGYDPATVVLSGSWASDNSLRVVVNGVDTQVTQSGFAALAPFSVNRVFKTGVNQVDFVVNNGDSTGGPTGLRIEGLVAAGAKGGTATAPSLTVSRSGQYVQISLAASATGVT